MFVKSLEIVSSDSVEVDVEKYEKLIILLKFNYALVIEIQFYYNLLNNIIFY